MKKFASILFIWIFGMGVFTFLLAMVFYNDPNIVWYSIPVGVLFAVINVAYLKRKLKNWKRESILLNIDITSYAMR